VRLAEDGRELNTETLRAQRRNRKKTRKKEKKKKDRKKKEDRKKIERRKTALESHSG
jgi:hypothetical protein